MAPAASHGLPGDHEAVVAPPPGHLRFPLVDSMRAVAALFVLTAHGLFLAGVWQTAWYRGIFAHSLGLAIFPGLPGVFTGNWWVYYGLLQLFPIYDFSACLPQVLGCGIPAAVTLLGELTLYLILPLFAALIVGVTRARVARYWLRAELLLLATLAVASIGVRAWIVTAAPFRAYLYYAPACSCGRRAWGWRRSRWPWTPNAGRVSGNLLVRTPAWLSWLAGAAITVALGTVYPDPLLSDTLGNPGPGHWGGFAVKAAVEYVALGAAATLFVLPAVFGGGGTIRRRVMANPVLAWLGSSPMASTSESGGSALISSRRWEPWTPARAPPAWGRMPSSSLAALMRATRRSWTAIT